MSFATTFSSQQCFTTLLHGKPPNSPSFEQVSPTRPLIRSSTLKPLQSQPQNNLIAKAKSSFRTRALPPLTSNSVEQSLSETLVQEIIKTGKGVPEEYLVESIPPAVDEPNVWKEKLLLDLSVLSSSDTSSPEVKKELAKLRTALSEWGCFQIINHGIDIKMLDELRSLTKQFFSLPFEEKIKYHLPEDLFNGYRNSHMVKDEKELCWSDRYVLTLFPEDQRKINVWPKNPPECMGMLYEYSEKLKVLQDQVLKAMARSVGLDESCFLDMHGRNGRIVTRFSYYPPCPDPDKVYGAHPHSDPTTFGILLLDDQTDGLQVQKDNKWVKVPCIPGALYVNAGDFLEVMSNGTFKSVLHRALTNSETDRATVNTFYSPQMGNDIAPVPELVNDQHPKLYNTVNTQSFRKQFFQLHTEGKRVIDTLKD